MKRRVVIKKNSRPSRVLLYLILALFLMFALPQQLLSQEPLEYGVLPFSTPEGMMLLVAGEILHPDNASQTDNWIGYHIYKKSAGDKDFKRITETPLSRVGSLDELEAGLRVDAGDLATLINLENKQQLWEQIVADGDQITFLTIMLRPFRKEMGLMLWDHDVIDGREYEYQLTKVDVSGTESEPSSPITMPYGVPPIPLVGPVNVTAEASDEIVSISWNANPVDTGAYSYSVYRTVDTTSTFLRINNEPLLIFGDSSSASEGGEGGFIDTTVRTGLTYYYAVVSEDYGGNSSLRDSLIEVTMTDKNAPDAPQNVFANSAELGLEIVWDLVSENDVAGYNIFRSDDPDSNYVKINELILPKAAGKYVDRTVTISDRYYYRVSTIDISGNESHHSPRAVYLYQNPRPPLAPQRVTAKGQAGAILISWEENSEFDVRGYYVFRADRFGSEMSQVSPLIGGDTLSFVDTDEYLSVRGRYYYAVQAMNYTGIYSSYSLPAVASPLATTGPDAPLSFYGYQDAYGNRLYWSPPDDNTIAGYNVYRSQDGDSLTWVRITDQAIERGSGEYIDSTAEFSVPYLYYLRAVNSAGLEGGQSHLITLMRFATAPLSPGNVRVARAETGLRISWNQSLESGIVGYRVYRRFEGGRMEQIHKDNLTEDVTFLTDQNITQSVRYYYSVSAISSDGREGFRSTEVEYYVD